jgi:hypothetical protein
MGDEPAAAGQPSSGELSLKSTTASNGTPARAGVFAFWLTVQPIPLFCASVFGRPWNDDDFDIFDCDQNVGRVYRIDAHEEVWFWGLSFILTGKACNGRKPTLDEAKAAFKAAYVAWSEQGGT